jgi:hypothetical protein
MESKIMFLASSEGGSRIVNTATAANAAQKHYLEFYGNVSGEIWRMNSADTLAGRITFVKTNA